MAAGLALLAGCERADRIEHYTVLKPPPVERPASAASESPPTPAEVRDRMLAAIVPHESQGWFFKLTGPKDAVAAKESEFGAFLKSVKFDDTGKPSWTLPGGWQERPGSDIRYATLVLGEADGKLLELSVTVLPKSGDDASYSLVNINRWRGQMKLPPIEREQLPNESTTVELDGTTATVVNLLGTATAGGMGRGPFFSGAGDGK